MESVRKIQAVFNSLGSFEKIQKDYELLLNLEGPSAQRFVAAQPLTISLLGRILLLSAREKDMQLSIQEDGFELLKTPTSWKASLCQVSNVGYKTVKKSHKRFSDIQHKLERVTDVLDEIHEKLRENEKESLNLLPVQIDELQNVMKTSFEVSQKVGKEYITYLKLILELLIGSNGDDDKQMEAAIQNASTKLHSLEELLQRSTSMKESSKQNLEKTLAAASSLFLSNVISDDESDNQKWVAQQFVTGAQKFLFNHLSMIRQHNLTLFHPKSIQDDDVVEKLTNISNSYTMFGETFLNIAQSFMGFMSSSDGENLEMNEEVVAAAKEFVIPVCKTQLNSIQGQLESMGDLTEEMSSTITEMLEQGNALCEKINEDDSEAASEIPEFWKKSMDLTIEETMISDANPVLSKTIGVSELKMSDEATEEFKAFLKAQMISRATFGCVFASAGFRLAANNGSEKLLEADAAIKEDIKSLYSLMNQEIRLEDIESDLEDRKRDSDSSSSSSSSSSDESDDETDKGKRESNDADDRKKDIDVVRWLFEQDKNTVLGSCLSKLADSIFKTGAEWLRLNNLLGHIENVLEVARKGVEEQLLPRLEEEEVILNINQYSATTSQIVMVHECLREAANLSDVVGNTAKIYNEAHSRLLTPMGGLGKLFSAEPYNFGDFAEDWIDLAEDCKTAYMEITELMEDKQEDFEDQLKERTESVAEKLGSVLPSTFPKVIIDKMLEAVQKSNAVVKEKKEDLGIKWLL